MARPPGRRRRSLLLSVPSRADRGEVSLSHLVVVLLVATISGALVASHLPTLISTEIETAVCTVTSSDCPTDRQHGPPGGPAASDPRHGPTAPPTRADPAATETGGKPETGDKAAAGGYWDCGWAGQEACDMAQGFGRGVKDAWADKAATACLIHICSDAAFDENWDGIKQIFRQSPRTTAATMWEESTKGIRDDWKNGHKGIAVARVVPSALASIFGGIGLGKLGKIAKNKAKRAEPAPETPDGSNPDGDHRPSPPRIYNIRQPTQSDIDAIFTAYSDNAARIGEWEHVFRSPDEVKDWLDSLGPERQAFLIEDGDSGGLAGVCFINDITRGATPTADFGLDAFAPYVGKGWMTEGMKRVIAKSFTPESEGGLGLETLKAQVEVGNTRSRNLVERLGGREEGTMLMYVNGAWRTFEKFSLKAGNQNRSP